MKNTHNKYIVLTLSVVDNVTYISMLRIDLIGLGMGEYTPTIWVISQVL